MSKEIINRVEKSGLINIDLSNFITKEVVELDICCFLTENNIVIEKEFRNLPPLIKAYIRVGAWIGPGAIVDSKFDTTDVLIVLKSKKILKKYAQLSFEKIH